MPTYVYRCAKCGEQIEAFQSFADAPLTKHDDCGGKLTKVLSAAGIVLKGSGFYKTDNRSSKKGSSKEKEHSGSSSGSSGSSDSGSSSGSSSDSGSSSKSSDSGSGSSSGPSKSGSSKPSTDSSSSGSSGSQAKSA